MILRNPRDLAHDFDVKLSPCMCSPGWRNGCNLLAYVIPSYGAYASSGLAYYTHCM